MNSSLHLRRYRLVIVADSGGFSAELRRTVVLEYLGNARQCKTRQILIEFEECRGISLSVAVEFRQLYFNSEYYDMWYIIIIIIKNLLGCHSSAA